MIYITIIIFSNDTKIVFFTFYHNTLFIITINITIIVLWYFLLDGEDWGILGGYLTLTSVFPIYLSLFYMTNSHSLTVRTVHQIHDAYDKRSSTSWTDPDARHESFAAPYNDMSQSHSLYNT